MQWISCFFFCTARRPYNAFEWFNFHGNEILFLLQHKHRLSPLIRIHMVRNAKGVSKSLVCWVLLAFVILTKTERSFDARIRLWLVCYDQRSFEPRRSWLVCACSRLKISFKCSLLASKAKITCEIETKVYGARVAERKHTTGDRFAHAMFFCFVTEWTNANWNNEIESLLNFARRL